MALENEKVWDIGTLVFAKLAKKDPYWPGLVVDPKDCGLENGRSKKTCVFWIGDNRVSMVDTKFIEDFKQNFNVLYNENNRSVLLQRAIINAIEIYYERESDISTLNGLTDQEKIRNMSLLTRPARGNLDVPATILHVLKSIKTLNKTKRSDDDEENNEKTPKKIKLDASHAMDDVKRGKLSIAKMCIVCNKYTNDGIIHPFFNGGICHQCKIEYRNSVFQMDAMGNKVFCIVCGVSEGQFQSRESFLWRFCKECSSTYFKAGEKDIHIKWTQHFKYNKPQNFLLTLNEQWATNLTSLFCGNHSLVEANSPGYNHTKLVFVCLSKPSCSKGLNKLKNCGFKIDNVEIKTLEDLKKDEIKSADIVVGRPCERNETWTREDRHNIAVKKVHTEFMLEFQKAVNRLKTVTWLYEMPAAIPSNFRDFTTRYLWEVQPYIFKSSDKSPLNEYRLVWTNMNQPTKEIKFFHELICHM